MAVKIMKEEKERELKELTDITVDSISFVEHGANKRPFKIVKSDEEDEMKDLAVQSVIVPKGMRFQTLSTYPKMEWLTKADVSKVELEGNKEKHTLLPVDQFDPSSIMPTEILPGAYVVTGLLKESNPQAILVTKDNLVSPLDSPVPAAAQEYTPTLYEQAMREFGGLQSLVFGVLDQSSADPKATLKTIKNGLKAFEDFIAKSLQSILEKSDEEEDDMKEEDVRKIVEETLATAVTPQFEAIQKGMDKLLKGDTIPEPTVESLTEDLEGRDKEIEDLKKVNEKLNTENEALKNKTTITKGAMEDEGDPKKKPEDLYMSDSPLAGVLTNEAKIREILEN